MIDFRYHLVSLIAVFLAVALGIIIGTTALNEPIQADIEGQVASLEQEKRDLEDQTRDLRAQLDTTQAFEEAVAPALVSGTLTDSSVLLVRANEDIPTETVEAVAELVEEAGGTVAGRLTLYPPFTDPTTEAALQGYVTGEGLPSGVQLPEADDTGQLVGALLAQVLMLPAESSPPDAAAISSVLAGLSALEVLSQDSDSVVPADHAIVLSSGAFAAADAESRVGALVDLVTALDDAGSGAVVAGDPTSATETGLLGVIRADPELSAAVSTVDNVEVAAGRISAVLALGQESEGTSGRYGTGQDTQPVPPVPTSAP